METNKFEQYAPVRNILNKVLCVVIKVAGDNVTVHTRTGDRMTFKAQYLEPISEAEAEPLKLLTEQLKKEEAGTSPIENRYSTLWNQLSSNSLSWNAALYNEIASISDELGRKALSEESRISRGRQKSTEMVKNAHSALDSGNYAAALGIYSGIESMREAMKIARKNAKRGDIILLSPAAASFGIFKNEFDRGEQFNRFVKKLN